MSDQGGGESLDRMLADLQREIIEQERALYSAKVIEEAHSPRNLGRVEGPDAYARFCGWCGDTMEVYLRLDGEQIKQAAFMTDGCGPTVACGSMLTCLVQGMSLEEAGKVAAEDLIAALDGLPEESTHCAELAVKTLHEAIANWWGRDSVRTEESRSG